MFILLLLLADPGKSRQGLLYKQGYEYLSNTRSEQIEQIAVFYKICLFCGNKCFKRPQIKTKFIYLKKKYILGVLYDKPISLVRISGTRGEFIKEVITVRHNQFCQYQQKMANKIFSRIYYKLLIPAYFFNL